MFMWRFQFITGVGMKGATKGFCKVESFDKMYSFVLPLDCTAVSRYCHSTIFYLVLSRILFSIIFNSFIQLSLRVHVEVSIVFITGVGMKGAA